MDSITDIDLAKRTFTVERRCHWIGKAVSATTYPFDHTLIAFHLHLVGNGLQDAFKPLYHSLLNAQSEDDHSNIASSILSEIELQQKLSVTPPNTGKEHRLWRITQSGNSPNQPLTLLVLPPITTPCSGQAILEHLALLQQKWIPAQNISSSEQEKTIYCIASLHRMGFWSNQIGQEPVEDTMAKICSLIMGYNAARQLAWWQQTKMHWLFAIDKVLTFPRLLRRLFCRTPTPLLPSPSSSTSLDSDLTEQKGDGGVNVEKCHAEVDEELDEKFDEKFLKGE